MAHGKLVLVKEFIAWGKGRRGCKAPVQVKVYENVIRAWCETERFTLVMLRKALRSEFPRHHFRFSYRGEDWAAIADRWTDDGIEEKTDA